MSHQHALNNILHFFAPIIDGPPLIEPREDYILETLIGCFRVAYSPATDTTGLFYARHPDDLAEIEDETGPSGIRHKDRLTLIKMFKVYHSKETKWEAEDERQQFDLSWLRREIVTYLHNIPRDQFREANSHRIAKDFHSSVFIGYRSFASQLAAGEFSGDIITKTDKNYLLLGAPESGSSNTQRLQNLFHWLGHQLTAHNMGTSFPLRTIDAATGLHHTSFKQEVMRATELSDFAIRLEQIGEGLDPVKWREAPLLPIYRGLTHGRDRAARQIDKFREIHQGGIESILRHDLPIALHLVLDGGLSFLGSLLIDNAGEIGVKEKLKRVPPEWHQIVDPRAKRLVSIDSNLHRRQIRPVPEHFGDLRWLNPQEHACSFAAAGRYLLTHSPERTFRRWTQSLLLSPYASFFEYRGAKDEVLTPDRLSQTRFVSQQVSNGMMLYYTPADGTLYAYYHRQEYMPPTARKLPVDAADFLKSGQVLKFNMWDWHAKMEVMPFDDFQNHMRDLAEAPELALPTADMPAEDVINSRPAPKLVAAVATTKQATP